MIENNINIFLLAYLKIEKQSYIGCLLVVPGSWKYLNCMVKISSHS